MWPLPTPDATFRSVLDALDPLVVMASVRDESSSIIDFTIEFMNDAASRLFVDPGGSLIGRRMLDVFPAHVGSGLFDAYRRVAESGEPLLTEELFDVGKTCSWFEVRICQLGEGVISMSHDISEHRAAEANARAQELMLQATFDAFLNPHVLVNAVRDEVGKIIDFVYVDANQKACEYNRIPREQLIGARVMDLLPGHAGAGLLAMYSHVVETGEPLALEDFAYEHELVGEERRCDILAVKIGDGLSYTWHDVTDRYNTARALQVSEDRYRLLAENSSDVVVLLDSDRIYRWVSPSAAAVLGWNPDEMVGKSSADFVFVDDHARLLAAVEHSKSGIAAFDDIRFRCADGSYRWLSGRSADVFVDGLPTARVVALRDVHELHLEREREAEMAQRYQWLVEYGVEAVVFSGPDGAIDWVSPEFTAALGWSLEDLAGGRLLDLVHPEDRRFISPKRDRVPGSDPAAAFSTVRLRTKTGDYRWLRGRATAAHADGGRLAGIVTGMQDVTDMMEADLARRRSEAMLRSVLDSSADQIVQFDRECRVDYMNDEVVRYIGVPKDELIGRAPEALGLPEEMAAQFREHVEEVLGDGVVRHFEIAHELPDGRRWFDISMSPVFGGGGEVEYVLSAGRDVTSRRAIEDELANRATRDRLTGLANREVLVDELDRALAASRRSDRCVGLMMVDLDHFKNVNDSLGHEAGDRLLVAAAERFSSIVRAGDLIARVGGDEFVVVLRDLSGITDALAQAERVVEAFRSPLHPSGLETYATASVGVTVSTPDCDSGDLLREADTALYRAKQAGRNQAAVFDASLRAGLSDRLQVEVDLRPALELGQFEVWYQPQVDLATGAVVAVEALLRWHHPSGVVFTADQFIDAADGSGMINAIGDWALLQACTQVARWNAATDDRPLDVYVNMSARQLAGHDLYSRISSSLCSSHLEPARLCIEITETTLLVQTVETRENLLRLAQAGVRLAVDDFGAGSASLAYLRDIQVDVLKIDRSFVTDIATNDHDLRLVDGIVALAARLGVEVIAQGVETNEQADTLRASGCIIAQGFLYSPALPADEFARLHLHSAEADAR